MTTLRSQPSAESGDAQRFGQRPERVRETDHYQQEYIEQFADRWDRLIDWDAREEAEGNFFVRLLHEHGARSVPDGLMHLGHSDTLGHTHLAGRQLERRPSKVDDAKALIVQKVGDRYKTLHEAFRKMDGAPRAPFRAILRNAAAQFRALL